MQAAADPAGIVDAAEDRALRNPGAPEPRAERPAGGRREPGAAPVGAPLGQPPHHASFAGAAAEIEIGHLDRSEEHTSELQSLMSISYAVFCLQKKQNPTTAIS